MLASRHSWSFKDVSSLQGKVAQGVYEEKKIILLLPMTYMNSSGEAARLVMDYFKIQTNNILVVADDVSFPFNTLKIKPSGSSGGHNGLKSIEAHFGTQIYPRMKIGVGAKTFGTLAD
jgi:PTH1 family peptidyl-tRNA hydrolase